MAKTRPPYPQELKRQIVELHRAGRTITELAEEFAPTEPTIRDWIRQAEADDTLRTDVLATDEREELREARSTAG